MIKQTPIIIALAYKDARVFPRCNAAFKMAHLPRQVHGNPLLRIHFAGFRFGNAENKRIKRLDAGTDGTMLRVD